jgi:MFS family permease
MAYRISIGAFLSFGFIFSSFVIGTIFSSIGWFFLGIKNHKKIWIVAGIISIFCSLYFLYFLIKLFINNSLISFLQILFRYDANQLLLISTKSILFYLIILYIILQLVNLFIFSFEFFSYATLASVILVFISIFLIFYSNTIIVSIIIWSISNSIAGIAISRIPEEILQGYIEKTEITFD